MDINIQKMEIYIPEYAPFSHFNSITRLNIINGEYLFIFNKEKENIPHIHLLNLLNQFNICLRLDIPDFYYGHSNIKYNFSNEQKEYINQWMKIRDNDNVSRGQSNWEILKGLWIDINSQFEEYSDNPSTFDWNNIFPEEQPDYRLIL